MLPAAILFLLLNAAIDRRERLDEARTDALAVLKGGSANSATGLLALLSSKGQLRRLDLVGARLREVQLEHKRVTRCLFDGADLDASTWTRCVFTEVSFARSLQRVATFEACHFTNVTFGRDLTGTIFSSCHFHDRIDFQDGALEDVRFVGCVLTDAAIQTMRPSGCAFVGVEGLTQAGLDWLAANGASILLPNSDQSAVS
jgi:uncharacterized protein YjbI with pentapeptide repeats